VTTPEWFVLRLYTFHFPGWRAYVDGDEVEIEIGRPEGFITVPVPAGEHIVSVRFENTPVRTTSWVVSAGTLVVLVAVLVVWKRNRDSVRTFAPARLDKSYGQWLGSILALILALKLAVFDPLGGLHLNSPPGEALAAQHQVEANFGGRIELLGYDLPDRQIHRGETFSLVLYWRALRNVDENYQTFVHVAQPLDTVWAQEDHLNPGGYPTARWPLDKYVWDEYEIYVAPDTPPGVYSLNVGLYLMSEGYRLRRLDEEGNPVGDSFVIDGITVTN
jgi:hypothetical protein